MSGSLKIFGCTLLALIAFAANSVLCRFALGTEQIDAASFTSVRLISGVVVLAIVMLLIQRTTKVVSKGSWVSGIALFIYAATFSFAYITLDTGTGALILFGAVQITIILTSIVKGNRLHYAEWLGTIVAFSGFVYLVLPGLTTPSILGFILMAISGIAWGGYTLLGKGSINPIQDSAYNFVRSIPLVVVLLLVFLPSIKLSSEGIILAVLSGGLASGLGYALWYMVLGSISATVSAVVQLLVPVLASIGGVLFVSEEITLRLIVSGALILSGVFLVVIGRHYFVSSNEKLEHNNGN